LDERDGRGKATKRKKDEEGRIDSFAVLYVRNRKAKKYI